MKHSFRFFILYWFEENICEFLSELINSCVLISCVQGIMVGAVGIRQIEAYILHPGCLQSRSKD